jgi:hypothetical protein
MMQNVTAIIRSGAFSKFGLIDEDLAVNADLDWSVRARDEAPRSTRVCQGADA